MMSAGDWSAEGSGGGRVEGAGGNRARHFYGDETRREMSKAEATGGGGAEPAPTRGHHRVGPAGLGAAGGGDGDMGRQGMCSFLAAFPARGWPRRWCPSGASILGRRPGALSWPPRNGRRRHVSISGSATGCQWQHITYEAQLAAKTGIVRDALERVGRFHNPAPLETLPAPEQYGYRNHARF